jgi:Fe-S cluster assembly protein SufD
MLNDLQEQLQLRTDLLEIRKAAWSRFSELGLPQKKQPGFHQFPFRTFSQETFTCSEEYPVLDCDAHMLPECRESVLVFVNGILRPDLSVISALPKQVVILPLAQAFRSYSTFLQQRTTQMMREEGDPFVALNLSLHLGGAFVMIPPKIKLAAPIQLLHIVTEPGIHAMPRLHVSVGAHAETKWISKTVVLPAESVWINGVFDCALDEGAQVHHVNLLDGQDQIWHLDATRVTLKRSSKFESVSVTTGSKAVRQDLRVSLKEEGAEVVLQGAWMLSDRKESHVNVVVNHEAPHCRSMQRFKGVLADVSQSSFEGKIFVRDVAQKTEAYQLNNNLILGERAQAHTKPTLEIFADDVKASHGATIAQLDEAQLFYLKTRGLSEEMSKQLLVRGFCQEILDQIPQESIRTAMKELTDAFIAKMSR